MIFLLHNHPYVCLCVRSFLFEIGIFTIRFVCGLCDAPSTCLLVLQRKVPRDKDQTIENGKRACCPVCNKRFVLLRCSQFLRSWNIHFVYFCSLIRLAFFPPFEWFAPSVFFFWWFELFFCFAVRKKSHNTLMHIQSIGTQRTDKNTKLFI